MRMTAPRTGAPEIQLAESQHEYMELTAAVYMAGEPFGDSKLFLTRWTFTPEERARIAKGEDIFVSQIIFPGHLFTPMNVYAGPEHFQLPDGS